MTSAGEHCPDRLLTLMAGGASWLLDAIAVREVCDPPRIRIVPGTPPALCGLLAIRGRVLPAVDLRVLLGMPGNHQPGTVIVLDLEPVPVALVGERVGAIRTSGELRRPTAAPVLPHPLAPTTLLDANGTAIPLIDAALLADAARRLCQGPIPSTPSSTSLETRHG